jgi:predicted phosphoadenosine phosphosulfate sulfurtransferase
MREVRKRIDKYVATWKARGYPDDIPDEVPHELAKLRKAPSYKAICVALLKNDHALIALGFSPRKSVYYMLLKRLEIEKRKVQS